MRQRRELRLFVPWLGWGAACVVAMWMFPGQETVPYHLGYAGLAVAFGLDTWSNRRAYLSLAGFTVLTGAVLVVRASTGDIAWEETSEIPLMCLLMALMVWHVSNRHAALAVANRLADREREQSERRERLVRVTSHEMRTPLTIATGYVDLLRSEALDEHSRNDLDVVHEELDRLSRACDRMLRLFRYHEDLPTTSVDLDQLLAQLAERWSVVVVRVWQVDASAGRVVGSGERVRACLDTLVENAIRYTEPGQRIRLFAHREGSDVVFGVADSGRGFDAQQALAINEPGELLPVVPPPTDSRSQTGLGLSLVREVIESRGGTVRAGVAPEGGALITLRVPIHAEQSVSRLGATMRPGPATVPHETMVPR